MCWSLLPVRIEVVGEKMVQYGETIFLRPHKEAVEISVGLRPMAHRLIQRGQLWATTRMSILPFRGNMPSDRDRVTSVDELVGYTGLGCVFFHSSTNVPARRGRCGVLAVSM